MFVIITSLLVIAIYYYTTRNHDYWAKRNIKYESPVPLFGTSFKVLIGKKSVTEKTLELRKKYKGEKLIGCYRGATPELIVYDIELVRQILTVDFAYFHCRGLGRKREFLMKNVFHGDGDVWRLLRQRMTPAFTTAKLKNIFPLIIRCAEKLEGIGENIIEYGGKCDVREIMARFTTEFIGACGFGIEMDSLNNEHSLFRALGKKIFTRTSRSLILATLYELFPVLRRFIYIWDKEIEDSFKEIVNGVRKQRNFKPSQRHDFIDLLMELEAKGKIIGDSIEHISDGSPKQVEMEISIEIMAAQVFIFFAAGFETSSSATSYTLHQLALNPDIQKKVQSNIDEVLSRYDNKLCYESIAEMSYLDMAFKEAMRMFPSLGVLNRVCTRQYTIPGTSVTIYPGVNIIIPVNAIQMDEQNFDNPGEFRPERFSAEEVNCRNKYVYLPFGDGPRACIGARLGHMQSLAGLAAFLQKFSVEPSTQTKRIPEIDHRLNIVQGVVGGLPLQLKLRDSTLM